LLHIRFGVRASVKEQGGIRRQDAPGEKGSLVKLYQGCAACAVCLYLGIYTGKPLIIACNPVRSRVSGKVRAVGLVDHIVGYALYLVAVIRGIAPYVQLPGYGVIRIRARRRTFGIGGFVVSAIFVTERIVFFHNKLGRYVVQGKLFCDAACPVRPVRYGNGYAVGGQTITGNHVPGGSPRKRVIGHEGLYLKILLVYGRLGN